MGTIGTLQALICDGETRSAREGRIRGVVANGACAAGGAYVPSRTGGALRRVCAEGALNIYDSAALTNVSAGEVPRIAD